MKKYLIFIFSVVVMFLCGITQCFADSVTVTLDGAPYDLGDNMVYQNVRVDFDKGTNWHLHSKWTNLIFVNQTHPLHSVPIGPDTHVYDTSLLVDHPYNSANTPIEISTGAADGAEYRIFRIGLLLEEGNFPGNYTDIVEFTVSSDTGTATNTALITCPRHDFVKLTVLNTPVYNNVDADHSVQEGYVQVAPTDMQLQVEANVRWNLYMRTTTSPNTLDQKIKATSASSYVSQTLNTFTTFPTTDIEIARGRRTLSMGNIVPAIIDAQSQITIPTGSITPDGAYPMNVIYTLIGTDTADED